MEKFFNKLFKKSEAELNNILKENIINHKKTFLVTANPEVYMRTRDIKIVYDKMMEDNCIITPDGEGVAFAAKYLHQPVEVKLAGVDTVEYLFGLANELSAKVYIYGSQQKVLDILKEKLDRKYPNMKVVGLKNGYDYNHDLIFKDMVEQQPDIVLVAFGVPKQEQLIAEHFDMFSQGIFVGCGGSLDVLSGVKKRAPQFFINVRLEWLYRLIKEPRRIKRFYQSNIKFLLEVRKLRKQR